MKIWLRRLSATLLAFMAGVTFMAAPAQAFNQADVDQLVNEHFCPECDLNGANLAESDLYRTILYGANLEGAILERAFLYGAILEAANLVEANLSGANLVEANLSGAILEGAYLEGAILEGATMPGGELYESAPFFVWQDMYGFVGIPAGS